MEKMTVELMPTSLGSDHFYTSSTKFHFKFEASTFNVETICQILFNPLSANTTKWQNTLK